jgi:colanic acid biosynthesis protein WcaH
MDGQVNPASDRVSLESCAPEGASTLAARQGDPGTASQIDTREPHFLPADEFAHIVRHTPLVSVDIVVRDRQRRVLVGKRNYEPAKGTYFVPGGRILKDETIGEAFARIMRHELNLVTSIDAARFIGVHEHFHPNSRFGPPGCTTHYVVLAYELALSAQASAIFPDDQHAALEWCARGKLLVRDDVHPLTKDYLRQCPD